MTNHFTKWPDRRFHWKRAWLLGVLLGLTGSVRGATFTVNMSNFQFAPKNQTVAVGDTVTWVNQDFTLHDTTSGVGGVPNGIWHSPLLNHLQTFSFTFNVPAGTYPYYCTPHVFTFNMVGTITVVAPPNQPPSVTITNPANGAGFTVGANIPIEASASDSDGSVTQVDFFANGTLIGSSSGPAFATTFNNAPAGSYSLTAVATDNAGATNTSAPVNISVSAGNVPPSVTITNPMNGAILPAGTNILVQASAEDSDGNVVQVSFQVNGVTVGTVLSPPYEILLTNLVTGDYLLDATAVDNLGATGSSPQVHISVGAPLSNAPPTVSITSPTNGSAFALGADVFLNADAFDRDGSVTQVVYTLRQTSPGTNFLQLPTTSPFSETLSNLVEGIYLLTATAIDNGGATGVSSSVSFSVQAPPAVILTLSPTNSELAAGSQVLLTVSAQGLGAAGITNASVFVDQTLLATSPGVPLSFVWTPILTGTHVLFASVLDQFGRQTTSGPVVISIFAPETTRPTVAITNAPKNLSRLTNSAVSLSGIASDNDELIRVEYQINDGSPQTALGLTNWLIQTNLLPGLNTIRVRSVDRSENVSFDATRFLTLVVHTSLVVTTVGDGTVTPDLNSQLLEIGRIYTVKAQPGPHSIFAGWEGGGLPAGNSSKLSFEMTTQLTNLVAHFTNNPFADVAGTYSGLFFDSDASQIRTDTSGFVSLRLDKLGTFSGKVSMNGTSFPCRAKFDAFGRAVLPVIRPAQMPIVFALGFDFESHSIIGLVTNAVDTHLVVVPLRLEQNPFSQSAASGLAGLHNFLIQATNNATIAFGTARVAANGVANTAAMFTPGPVFSFSSTISQAGESPLYVFFPPDRSVLLGWFELGSGGSIGGQFYLLRPGTGGPTPLQAITRGP